MKVAVIASLLFSILATILFFGQKLGISVILFLLPFILFTIYLLERHRKVKNRKAYLLILPILLLGATYGIYQDILFQVTNIIIMLITYNIMLIWAMQKNYQFEFFARRIIHLISKPFNYINKSCNFIGKVFPTNKISISSNKWKVFKQIILGIAISIPILIVVVTLLSSADNIFAREIRGILNFILQKGAYLVDYEFCISLVIKIMLTIALTIYLISFIINLLSKNPWKKQQENSINIQIETIILNTIATILNIVYFIFCKIQITSLFENIGKNISYANYAREGFFQLMAVSIINFAFIIITTKNTNKSSKWQIYYRKVMNIIIAIATVIILISAFVRMNLYSKAYGYTYLRILVYFALITELILIIPTIVYIIKNKFSPWKYYFVIILAVYTIMNYSNISGIIARKNVERYFNQNNLQNVEIDLYYLRRTKTDGLDYVIKLYKETTDPRIKENLESYLRNLGTKLSEPDNFVEWNYSRYKARKLLKEI